MKDERQWQTILGYLREFLDTLNQIAAALEQLAPEDEDE